MTRIAITGHRGFNNTTEHDDGQSRHKQVFVSSCRVYTSTGYPSEFHKQIQTAA